MYHFSRSIYRELADAIVEDRAERAARPTTSACCAPASRRYRLATGSPLLRATVQTLFNDIRDLLPMNRSCASTAWSTATCTHAREWFEERETAGYDIAGNRLECRATTRGARRASAAAAAQRLLPCHQHLAETEGVPLAA